MITIDQASEMGAKGAEPTETERLLFEAWMRGHCWLVQGDWDGKSYVHESENTGYLHPGAMLTRQLWAAWRDRAALAEQPAQEQEPVAIDRIIECAKRLVEHADFQLGGVLSQDSKAKDIPSRAVSQVKARHLAALRDALANTSPPAQRKPLTRKQLADAWIGTAHITHATERQIAYARAVEAAHGIGEKK